MTMTPNPMADMMGDAIGEAFGAHVSAAMQPLVQRITELEVIVHSQTTELARFTDACTELLGVVNRIRDKGGVVGKLLGG